MSTPSPVETQVARIRELLERGQFAAAQAAAEALALEVPENRDVLYMLAVSHRYQNHLPAALGTLARLEALHPGFSRLYQERGHCYVALRDAPRALEAYLKAVHINPALPASWAKLEGLYRMAGDLENAAMAAEHVATLKALPPEVVTATALFSDGDLTAAENMVREYLLKHGNHIEAMRLLARIGIAREVLDDAEILLCAVLELAPDYHAARFEYARVLLDRHKHRTALEQLEMLLAREPGNRHYKTLYATASVGVGEQEKALAIYRELLADTPRAADVHLSVAHSLKTLGRREEAIDSYRAAAAARPNYGDAYWSLANLKTYRFPDEELARMRAAEAAPSTALVDRYHLCFALGKALADRGEYEESWRFYERGNALKKSESRYRPELIERNTRLQRETFTREFIAARAGWGAHDPDPIFIVGLPRSGSTLLEQILASHSKVEGTAELADIPRMVHELQGRDPDLENPRYPRVLAELAAKDCLRLGEKYLEDTRVYRTANALRSKLGNPRSNEHPNNPYQQSSKEHANERAQERSIERPSNYSNDHPPKYPTKISTNPYIDRFIDKMPNNFRHLGLIHLILPNARIIDARREPMACCFSNLKQLFASGQEFTYSAVDIARYYRTYLDLMAHWHAVLPGRILRIQHEDVVDDLEGNVRRMLDFCGLEFEPACVAFHETERSVRTASSEQVRRPIYREGLDQWKHYEPWLGDLRDTLGDALVRYRS
jgi:tetratricopeptide (TPR) repeat protein